MEYKGVQENIPQHSNDGNKEDPGKQTRTHWLQITQLHVYSDRPTVPTVLPILSTLSHTGRSLHTASNHSNAVCTYFKPYWEIFAQSLKLL